MGCYAVKDLETGGYADWGSIQQWGREEIDYFTYLGEIGVSFYSEAKEPRGIIGYLQHELAKLGVKKEFEIVEVDFDKVDWTTNNNITMEVLRKGSDAMITA